MVQYLADIWSAVSSACLGMGVTIKHLVRKPVTQQYPDERWVLPERFRGFVHNNIIRCNACLGCAKACPVSCIYIETEGKGKDRFMTRYAVDYNKCIWCGLCTEPCPTHAISMSHDYDHSLYFRQRLVYEFVDPQNPVPCHKEKRLQMGYYVEQKEPAAAKPTAAPTPPRPPDKAPPAGSTPAAGADKPGPTSPAVSPPPEPGPPPAAGTDPDEGDKGENQ